MVVLPELSSPIIMIFIYFLPASLEKSLPKNPPIIIIGMQARAERRIGILRSVYRDNHI